MSMLAELGKHAEAFGNQALSEAVQTQSSQWEKHGNINLQPIANAINAELNATGPARFNDNVQAIAKIGHELGLELNGITQATDAKTQLPSMDGLEGLNAYERFREKMVNKTELEQEKGLSV